jgi:uncharacterized protein (DUF2252 family)
MGVVVHDGTGIVTQKKSSEQRRRMGRSLRDGVPLESHGEWEATAERDTVSRLQEDDKTRVPVLVPVRYARMLQSPFAFLRGAAAIMADDLATTPNIGVRVQTCGDAHLGNFGIFATPERNLHFDITDFDETLPAPWEWDVKRLAVSVQVAADSLGMDVTQTADSVAGTVRAYRERMRDLAELGPLDVWYDRTDVQKVLEMARRRKAKDLKRALRVDKVRQRTSLTALPRLTAYSEGGRRIMDDPPLIDHEDPEAQEGASMISRYAQSLPADRRLLLGQYVVIDTARKVVGIGSVGTRCFLSLLMDPDGRTPIFLQLKEANEGVLARHAGRSEYHNHGQRVVVGQRLMQAASDIFLGWTSFRGHDYYVRQFRDMKGSVEIDAMQPIGFASYCEVCGSTLSPAHARSGHAATISGYLGNSTKFDEAMVSFAAKYGEQTRLDYQTLASTRKNREEIRS